MEALDPIGDTRPGVRHVLAVTSARAERRAVESIATRLAQIHAAELTLMYALAPLLSSLPTGGEAIAQREELGRAVTHLRDRIALAERYDVAARPEVREGLRSRAVSDVLASGPDADLVVVSAPTASRGWNPIRGRRLERLARRISAPLLAVHHEDVLDLDRTLRIALVHWTREGALSAAERVGTLFTTRHGAPSLQLVLVGSGGLDDADRSVTSDIPPAVEGTGSQASGPVEDPLDATARDLRDRGIDATASLRLGGRAESGRAEIRALEPDLVALAADAPRAHWLRRGALGRLAPRLDRPVLAL